MANNKKLQTHRLPNSLAGKQNARNNSGLNLFHSSSYPPAPENKDGTTNFCICWAFCFTWYSILFEIFNFESFIFSPRKNHHLWAKDLPPHPSGHRCGRSNATPIDRSFHPESNYSWWFPTHVTIMKNEKYKVKSDHFPTLSRKNMFESTT